MNIDGMAQSRYFLIAFSIVAIFGSLLYFMFDPAAEDLFPDCPFHLLTGLFCPGCGSQRALHQLLHGNLLKAANYNAMLTAVTPLLVYHFAVLGYARFFRRQNRVITPFNNPVVSYTIVVFVILFGVLRNLPLFPFEWLAP